VFNFPSLKGVALHGILPMLLQMGSHDNSGALVGFSQTGMALGDRMAVS